MRTSAGGSRRTGGRGACATATATMRRSGRSWGPWTRPEAAARARPDLVRQVVDKVQREGVLSTLDSVRNRLDQPLPLGYSAAGIVTAVGPEAGPFRVGDRVACAGSGYACHAEVLSVPRNLVVP